MWETWKKKIKRQEIWRGKKSDWQLCGNWKMQMTWSWFQLSDAPMLELITAVGRRKRDEDSANEILKTLERNSIPDTKVLEGQVERWRMWEFPGEGSWQEFLPPGLMSLGWQGLTSGGHPTSCSRKMWPQGQRWESERPWLDPQRGKRIVLEPQRQSSSGCISNALSIQKGLQEGLLKSKPKPWKRNCTKEKGSGHWAEETRTFQPSRSRRKFVVRNGCPWELLFWELQKMAR